MRRWFQFSLRSLLLFVLLVATYCAGWKSSQLKYEREFEEAVRKAVEAQELHFELPPLVSCFGEPLTR